MCHLAQVVSAFFSVHDWRLIDRALSILLFIYNKQPFQVWFEDDDNDDDCDDDDEDDYDDDDNEMITMMMTMMIIMMVMMFNVWCLPYPPLAIGKEPKTS